MLEMLKKELTLTIKL